MPDTTTSTHFVAELQIKKVERTIDKNVAEGKRERTLDDVTKIVIKADTLERLTEKLGAHISLVEED
jgi:hypothetical protein